VLFRIPEPPISELACPKCGSENIGRKIYVWRVADERGQHWECDACATAWGFRPKVAAVPLPRVPAVRDGRA
jgi:predicted RNA-binding Zn-ribbon protein involved in translation (DUF1610 family)